MGQGNDRNYVISGLKYPASKEMIKKTNELVEKSCKIAYFIIVQVALPGLILPKVIVSYFVYFTTEKGPDAFELSVLMW